MKMRSGKYRRRAGALLLAVALLCGLTAGCSFPSHSTAPERESAASGPYQQGNGDLSGQTAGDAGTQETLTAQDAFDDLCGRFLREQLAGSFLNLHYSMVSPEDHGITGYDVDLGEFSLDRMREDRSLQRAFQAELAGIDQILLDPERRLTYRILEEAFRLEEAGDGLELYYQPLVPATGIQAQLPILLAEFAFRSRQDIEDYLTMFSSIDTYYRQILEFEQERAAAGLFMTDACAEQIIEESAPYLLPPENNFMTTAFDQRIDDFEGLTGVEREDYKARNAAIVETHFIPAYELLTEGLAALEGTGVNDQGMCFYPEGRDYYEYLVRSSIGTTYGSIRGLRDAIEDQIDADLQAMSQIIREHPETAEEISAPTFAYTDPDQILSHLSGQIAADFPEAPECHYVTKYVPDELSGTLGPAFFLTPPIDDYDDCVIYINPDITSDSQDLYPTLAHEGIPGHMYQNTYFLSHCGSDLRKVLTFTSYSEGWATYVENYSYTTDNGLPPELGRLLAHNVSANLGIHAMMDININYFGWTREQTGDLLASYFDTSDPSLTDTFYNAMLNSPVNYLEYYAGYLEIIQMRDKAIEARGSRFRLKDFHQFLLDTGPAPFTVIYEEFLNWLTSEPQ